MDPNFDKKLKGILENPPEIPFDEKAWSKMDARLRADEPSGGAFVLPWWAVAALWLISLGALGFGLHHKIEQSNQLVTALRQQMQPTGIARDTIVQHRTVFVYDTIYQYRNSRSASGISTMALATARRPYRPVFSGDAFAAASWGLSQHFSPTNAYTQPSLSEWQQLTGLTFTAQRAAEKAQALTLQLDRLQPFRPLDLGNIDYRNDRGLADRLTVPAYLAKNNISPLLYLQPTGFQISAGMGMGKNLAYHVDDGRHNYPGLMAELMFGQHFRLALGAEYADHNFKIERTEEFALFPAEVPQDPRDILDEIRVQLDYLQIPFGFKYALRAGKKWRPVLGIGLIARINRKQQLKYQYRNFSDTYQLGQNLPTQEFQISSAWGSLGIEYQWTDHWSLALESRYQEDFLQTSFPFQQLQMLILKGGVKYEF